MTHLIKGFTSILFRSFGALLLTLLLITACGGDQIGVSSSKLTITPSGPFKLALGGEVDLKAQVFNEQGDCSTQHREQSYLSIER